jgi:hypothetical protein
VAKIIRVTPRPLVAVVLENKFELSNRMISESALAFRNVLSATLPATGPAEPLGEFRNVQKWFLVADVGGNGKVAHGVDSVEQYAKVKHLADVVHKFVERFLEPANEFTQQIQFQENGTKSVVVWKSIGPVTGIATIEEGGFSETAIFLSGLDNESEEIAIKACEATVTPSRQDLEQFRQTFQAIREEQRPLFAKFGTRGYIESAGIRTVATCLAGAFFRMRGVA